MRLPARAQAILASGEVKASVVSYWELMLTLARYGVPLVWDPSWTGTSAPRVYPTSSFALLSIARIFAMQ